jgi:disulfide bond formation protein DsbB
MDLNAVQVFTSLLAVVALIGSLLLLVLRIVMQILIRIDVTKAAWINAILEPFAAAGLWLGALVATVATVGSLYYSESAGYIPCQLCWYQRIAMYPLAVILWIAAVRKDRAVIWYVLPIAASGAVIAGWHRLIELRPQLETGSCSLVGPSCADFWFERFGFVTLAFMAFSGFISIMILTLLATVWAPPIASPLGSSTPRTEI